QRGEAIRCFGQLLRENKDALGTLVSLENGKIKAEGDGEVQEMIDIADFAVGQSRMLYGKTMPSERARHRMMEQWHPLGIVGVITAFNFPVAVWAWNAMLAAVCGNAVVWKPSPKTPLTALAVQTLANRIVEALDLPPLFVLCVCDNAPIARASFAGGCDGRASRRRVPAGSNRRSAKCVDADGTIDRRQRRRELSARHRRGARGRRRNPMRRASHAGSRLFRRAVDR